MNRTEALTEVMQDPTRSERERQIATRALQAANVNATDAALGAAPDPHVMADDTRMMLAALKVERIADLNEDIYERHCIAHCVKHTDPIVTEFRYWIPPSAEVLELIGLTLRGYWQAVYDRAAGANRPDAQAHARRVLAALP